MHISSAFYLNVNPHFQNGHFFSLKKLKTSENKLTSNKLKMNRNLLNTVKMNRNLLNTVKINRNLLNTVDNYVKFDNPNCNSISLNLDRNLVTLTFDIKLKTSTFFY